MPFYEQKIAAANLMDRALRAYQETAAEKGVFEENYKDPRLDAIIGQQFSLITTDFSVFETKIIGANPNFAAVAVDLLTQAGVKRGDYVAVAFTGAHPGVNTAVLCACEALGADACHHHLRWRVVVGRQRSRVHVGRHGEAAERTRHRAFQTAGRLLRRHQ